jgi:AbrB family looped-hinge helix DNA binding protein
MKVALDSAGRMVIPKPFREELGLTGGVELDVDLVNGHLEISAPPRRKRITGPRRRTVTQQGASRPTDAAVRRAVEIARERR